MAKKFKGLTKDFSPERRERIEARKAKLREEMNLAELRQALSLTQNTLAEALGVGQAEISKVATVLVIIAYVRTYKSEEMAATKDD